MIRIRSGRGLGDSIYLRAVVDHLVGAAHRVCALSDYPGIFAGSGASVEPFTREGSMRIAHYSESMPDQSVTQWASILRRAGLPADVPLRIKWTVQNPALVERIRAQAAGRPLILVHGGRVPMERTDGYGADLIPRREAFDCALGALGDCYRVRIGKAPHLYPLQVDADMNGSTSVADLLDLASVCDGVVAQCSFAVPLAEAFDRPLLAIWAAAGMKSTTTYLRGITPAKVLSKVTSRFAIDNWPAEQIAEAARAFRRD
jgi:hypothetical protein